MSEPRGASTEPAASSAEPAAEPAATVRPTRAATTSPRTHSRPNPLPSRLVMGIGALAALSIMGAGMGRLPAAVGEEAAAATADEPVTATLTGAAATRGTRVERPVRYVRLKPGEKAPRGARVIREKAPAPRVVVRWVSAPASASVTSRAPVARTRQSGG